MIRAILNFYILIIVVDTVLSYLPQVQSMAWAQKLKKVADFGLNPIRRILPPDLPFDLSPIALICIIKLIEALW